TIEYYGLIIAAYRERQTDSSYPSIIINSVDLNKLLGWITTNQLEPFAEYLVSGIDKLARAGADFGAISAGTPHIVFEEVRARSPIPLISIVEATREAAAKLKLRKIALFGTRFTMQGRFYPDVFSKAGI